MSAFVCVVLCLLIARHDGEPKWISQSERDMSMALHLTSAKVKYYFQ